MRTKDLLSHLYGPEAADGFHSRLADIAGRLVEENEERESRRMAEADLRDALAGQGPMLDTLQRALVAEQRESLTDSRLPAVLTFDAYCIIKDASKESPDDRGLKQASHALYDRWNQDPLGYMTVGELVSYRDHFLDMFPKSAAKRVFDVSIPEVGFQTLTDLPLLTRIASEVVDQESYERAVEANGLDGDRPECWRARAYIKGIANLAESADRFELRQPTLREASERALLHVAQELGGHESPEKLDGTEGMPESMHAPGEEELPHNEYSEEMASIESPITGEELVVELGVRDEQRVDGMEPDEHEGKSPASAPLPGMFENRAQLEEREHEMTEGPGGEMGDEMMVEERAEARETVTTIVDPTSGQELQLTLSVIEDEEEVEEEPGFERGKSLETPMLNEMDELGGGHMERESSSRQAKAPPGREKQVKELKKKPGVDNPFAVAWSSYDKSHGKKPKSKSKKAVRLSKDDVRNICAGMGVTPAFIESKLLNGDEVAAGAYAIRIGANDSVELRRLLQTDSTKNARVVRSASLAEFDGVVEDFMALTAAQFAPQGFETGTTTTAAAATTATAAASPQRTAATAKTADYLLTTDVPQGAAINAKRMMHQVWEVSAGAQGEMLDDGRLSIVVREAQERDINRIARVLTDVFGISNIETQKLRTANYSPYVGASPIERRPAGAPSAPMSVMSQRPATGTGAQHEFIKHHTDPMRQAESEHAGMHGCAMCASMDEGEYCPDHKHMKAYAQLEEGVDESMDELPPPPQEVGDELGGSMPPEMGGPMGAMPGAPMGAPMGGPLGAPMSGMGGPIDLPDIGGQPDASQIPLDIGSGHLQPEDDEAVRAAMMHFRNMGMLPLEAVDKFTNAYSALLDKYGDEKSPQRALAEAAIIRAMAEAFGKPAIVPASGKSGRNASVAVTARETPSYGSGGGSGSGSGGGGSEGKGKKCSRKGCTNPAKSDSKLCKSCYAQMESEERDEMNGSLRDKKADMPSPGHISPQHPGKVTVSKQWPKGDAVENVHTPPTQPGSMQGTYSDTNMTGHGNPTDHSWGGDHKPDGPQTGSQTKNKGTSYTDTNLSVGTDGNEERTFGHEREDKTPHLVTAGADDTSASAIPNDLIVRFDSELGDFHLFKGHSRLSIHASLNEALASAERRKLGTELKILVENEDGVLEEI